ncbi:MAG: transposase [Candidatus Binatia bacterium]|nr:transposase [Candidatus Binatia bacterium]
MARKPRVHFTGALYHVMCRGNQGQSIFTDDQDRRRYWDLLRESQERYSYRLFAYVLMDNHVHHLIQIERTPLSKVMQNLLFRYTRYWNGRYKKTGHLFQGRYKAILCDKESYLLGGKGDANLFLDVLGWGGIGMQCMPRHARTAPGGIVYHALNRGNARNELFQKAGDYAAFQRIMAQAMHRFPAKGNGKTILSRCAHPGA